MPVPIRILLASHQPMVRSGLRLLLDREPDLQVIAEAANGREAIVLSDYRQPDVVLLDMNLPLLSGIAVARQISSRVNPASPVFVSANTDQSYVHEAFKAGAQGYVAEDFASSDLPRAIRTVACGKLFLSPAICSQLLEANVTNGNISERERAAWCFLAAGYGKAEIEEVLEIGLDQIRLHPDSLHVLPEAVRTGYQ